MEEAEFKSFVADMEKNGLQEPIWKYQGSIIDGVHRYRACQLLGIVPTYREWDGVGSLVSFVASRNFERRHLTSSQRAIVAMDVAARLAQEAAEKEHERKRTLQRIAKSSPELPKIIIHAAQQASTLARTNHTYVTDVQKIVKTAPELKEKIRRGVFTVPQAKTLARLPACERQTAMDLVETGRAKTPKAAVLEIRKGEREAQAQAAPEKPWITQASWDQWLPKQPLCDLLLTDPPYSTDMPDIERFAQAWLPLALSKVRPTGRAYVCIGAYPREIRAYLNVQMDWPVAQILVWSYRNTMGPKPVVGYKQNWQAVLYFVGQDAPPLDCPLLTEQFSAQEINAPDGRLGERYHSWQKPDFFAEQLIRHSTKPGATVLDCFSGTGTFLLAAQRLGRIGKGCDTSEKMLALAEKRGCAIER